MRLGSDSVLKEVKNKINYGKWLEYKRKIYEMF